MALIAVCDWCNAPFESEDHAIKIDHPGIDELIHICSIECLNMVFNTGEPMIDMFTEEEEPEEELPPVKEFTPRKVKATRPAPPAEDAELISPTTPGQIWLRDGE